MSETRMMSFLEHLGELRKKITVSLVALIAIFMATFNYSEHLLEFVMFPLRYNLDFSVRKMYVYYVYADKLKSTKLVFLAPAEGFWMNMKISLVAAFIFALPIIFQQLWSFISPGLHSKEKKYFIPFVLIATTLFLAGASFCFFIVLPFALDFLLSYKVGDYMMPMLSVGQYVDFCLKFVLAFGAVFELPVLIVFATRLGFVTPQTLAKNRRYAIVIAFLVAAILTPTPDAFNQTLMALPMIVLYEVGILASRIFTKKEVAQ
jgi:sec-independent protein translocase protein TatC